MVRIACFSEFLEVDGDLALPQQLLVLAEFGLDGFLQSLDLADAGELVGVAKSGGHLVVVGEDAIVDFLVGLIERILLHHDLAVDALPLLNEVELGVAEGADGLLAKLHGGEHVLFGDLIRAGLDHGNEVASASELQVQIGVVAFLVGGIDDKLAGLAIAADADASQRALERNPAQGHGKRGAHGADDVDGIHLIDNEGGGHDVDLVTETVGEAGADGAIDHAGGKRGLVAGTTFALEIAAGDAAHGVHLLDEVDRQGEEVVVLTLLGDDDGHEGGGVALLHQHGAGSLLGELAGLERIGLAVEFEGLGYESHFSSFISVRHIAHGRLHVRKTVSDGCRGRGRGALTQEGAP